jgi:shikimate kinase
MKATDFEHLAQILDNIFLVGMMGAGKTTIGKLLAKKLHKSFFDSDQEIENRTGVKIPVIFEIEGEAKFRSRETMMLEELVAKHHIVLATGGGIVLSEKNRELLSRHGTVIYLNATAEDLWQRIHHDKNRPLLHVANPQEKLQQLFHERDAIYRSVANIIVNTDNQNLQNLVNELELKLNQFAHEKTKQ